MTSQRSKYEDLSPIQAQIIALLLAGYSQRDCELKTGVTQSQIAKWHKDPKFAYYKKKAVSRLIEAGISELAANMQIAIRKLIDIIENPNTPIKTQLTAINMLLQNVTKTNVMPVMSATEGDVCVDDLIKTASTREDLEKALQLQIRWEQSKWQMKQKATEEEVIENYHKAFLLAAKYIPKEMLSGYAADYKNMITVTKNEDLEKNTN